MTVSESPPNARVIRDAAWSEGEIIGDPGRVSLAARPLDAIGPGVLSFMSRQPVQADLARNVGRFAGVTLICSDTIAPLLAQLPDVTLIVATNPRLAFMRAVKHFFVAPPPSPGIHASAVIDPTANIDSSAVVGPSCYVGPGCVIGPDCILGPGVALMHKVVLGGRVSIAGGTVVGADGFGYERNEHGELEKFPHIGGVEIGNDVEIGSNTSIDRGTLGATRIGARARIDNQVHIAHNVEIGEDAAIIAQAMIGGSVKIGPRSWIAPSATIMNQVAIGSDATVGLGAVVVKAVPDGATVMGSPAQSDVEFRRARSAIKKLTNDLE